MDNHNESETVKIPDSAYSNSCSNSQSRRSHSSKSTRSGSNSSGSSGYGGKQSTSGSSDKLGQTKKEKEPKKKKLQIEPTVLDVVVEVETRPSEPVVKFDESKEEIHDVDLIMLSSVLVQNENGVENMDVTADINSVKDEVVVSNNHLASTPQNCVSGRSTVSCPSLRRLQWAALSIKAISTWQPWDGIMSKGKEAEGFSCVISMHDGVVVYTTGSLTATLGFPKDMWIGRSFIDFVHPKDRNTFAEQITKQLAGPKNINDEYKGNSMSNMVCRIRRYRGLVAGFGIKEVVMNFMPFLLQFYFKNIDHEEGNVIYLVIQATPFFSAFKTPHEVVTKAKPFVMRHAANGNIEYVDPEVVSYMGYLPQDLIDKNALFLYHPDDLNYIYQMYEIIVKDGILEKSKPYRMLTQNGDYVKLETKWSSFINPWSSRLEFVTGKHEIIEGPGNPDIFYVAESGKSVKISEEEKKKAQTMRDNILRILNKVPTKPAEIMNERMSKRFQDLASIMENLIEEQPKPDEEMQDPDNNCFERDSVMLGGLSPHHDCSDSKSSTMTPLSYNQLNYNENLHRYFERQHFYSFDNYNVLAEENTVTQNKPGPVLSHCLSPMVPNSVEASSSCESKPKNVGSNSPDPVEEYQPIRLTESILNKHNSEKEKELMKVARVVRSNSKGERDKATNETRQKKKEHLARCNATYQPTTVGHAPTENLQPHGVKRASKHIETENISNKLHCSATRQSRCRLGIQSTGSAMDTLPPSTVPTTTVNHWSASAVNNSMNTFFLGVGIPQQMPIMSPIPAIPGMLPMYYTPARTAPIIKSLDPQQSSTSTLLFQPPAMQCMVYGQPMYSSPFMYPPMTTQLTYPPPQPLMTQTLPHSTLNPLGLNISNYEQNTRCMSKLPYDTYKQNSNNVKRVDNPEEVVDKTDDESSYSSFYSSFFKTESGSTEDSEDFKRKQDVNNKTSLADTNCNFFKPKQIKNVTTKKMVPPWLEQVCVTSELVYKYQIRSKNMEEVLNADKQEMKRFEQPSTVNDQLGQLYLDLQLEGVTSRLTLDEGITSSSSSGEETSAKKPKGTRKKYRYSKLVMIYEEDAPMPSPSAAEAEEEQNTEA